MASSSKGAELGTQIELTRPQRPPEQKHKAPDNIGVSGAIGALNQDNPQVKDRTDLKNLAAAGRKYRRFDTMAQYKEAKSQRGNIAKADRNEPIKQKRDEVNDETKRIYEEPDLDPVIRQTNDEISSKTNLAPNVQAAFASNDPLTINQTWFNTRNRIGAQTWGEFINKYPDKAAAYAEKHQGIRMALEEIKVQELAAAQAQTGEQVQAESDQLLADSVRVSENNRAGDQSQTAEQPNESNAPEVTTAEVKTDAENELLSTETAGAQAILLLGGETGTEIDRAKIEAIAEGGPINTEKANKASLGERDKYWNSENSPYKDMTFEQQLEKWQGTMQAFFDQYKGKPEAEFFKRVGIDLENENAVREIYQTYFVDGEGDLGLFSQKIAQNNSAEQIQENRAIIERLGKMYGEKSAKVMVEMTIGIKNAQTDVDSFIESAQNELKKGPDMYGADLIDFLDMGNVLAKNVVASAAAESGTSPIVDEKRDEEGSEKNRQEAKKTFRESYRASADHKSYKKDKWRGSSGEISLNGDYISFTPTKETHGEFNRDVTWMGIYTQDYDADFQSYRPNRIVVDKVENFERGAELSVDVTDEESWDPKIKESTGMKRVPTPFLWELLETSPESVGKGGRTFSSTAYGSESLKAKKYIPGVDSFYGIGGRDPELLGETTMGVGWDSINVDRQTLVRMQNQAIEYLEKQVQEGQMTQEMLEAAKGLIDSHKAPDKIERGLKNDRGKGKNKENPKLYVTFLQGPETWKQKGQVRAEGNLIVYDDDKYRKKGERREVEIATTSIDTSGVIKKVLTKQSWDILEIVPEAADTGPNKLVITEATTNSLLDRKGEWKKFVKPFATDGATLGRMQQMIRTYVDAEVQQGNMDTTTLFQIDNLLKLKQATLIPDRSSRDELIIYRLKGEKTKAVEIRQIKREPTLVEKIAEHASNGEQISSVPVTDSDISRYLRSKKLPMGTQITNLDISFQGSTARIAGIIDVPIPMFGGKINFGLDVVNNPDGSGLKVTGSNFETKSGSLRKRLGDVETQLNKINSFIGDDINEQLRYVNPSLRLLGLSISPDGTFSARVQNAQQAAA